MKTITPEVKKIIEKNPLALATADKKGHANVIAVAYPQVVDRKTVVITDNFMSHTRNNILANKSVCLAVWNSDWKGYKIVGKARYYEEGKWKKIVENITENHGLPIRGAIVVKVEKVIKLK